MKKIEVVLKNKDGLHARASAVFVQHTNKFKCDIFLTVNSKIIDAKSIMGLLALGVSTGDVLKLTFDGIDEVEAAREIKNLLESTKLPNSAH